MRYQVSGSITVSSRAARPAWTGSDSGSSPGEALIRLARRARDFLRNRLKNPKANKAIHRFCLMISGQAIVDDLLPNDGSYDAAQFLDDFMEEWYQKCQQDKKEAQP